MYVEIARIGLEGEKMAKYEAVVGYLSEIDPQERVLFLRENMAAEEGDDKKYILDYKPPKSVWQLVGTKVILTLDDGKVIEIKKA
jgi:hypothetical protein